MTEDMRNDHDKGACDRVRERARRAILERPADRTEKADTVHLAVCSDCREEVDRISRLDALLAEALEASRGAMPLPSEETIEVVLRRARETPPEAILFRNIRLSTRRMLWLTILVLSFLLVAAVGGALLELARRLHGG